MEMTKPTWDLREKAYWWAAFGSYFVYLTIILLHKSIDLDFASFLRSHLWNPFADILLYSFAFTCGFYLLFAAFVGPIAFTLRIPFRRPRVVIGNATMSVLHLLGNPMHFNKDQWGFVHFLMCGQLIATGLALPASKVTNWMAFGLLVFAFLNRIRVPTWILLDYIWGAYFAVLAIMASFAPLSDEVY